MRRSPKEAAFAALMNRLFFLKGGMGRDLACLNGLTFNENLQTPKCRYLEKISTLESPIVDAEVSLPPPVITFIVIVTRLLVGDNFLNMR